MEIKKMSLNDFNTISETLNDFDNFWSKETLKNEFLNSSNYYIVAIESNNILGFAGVSHILDEYSLDNIVVKTVNRNKHIGTIMLSHLIEYSKSKKASFLTLEVSINNHPAIRLYENFKFKKVGIRKHYYNNTTDALLMTLFFN